MRIAVALFADFPFGGLQRDARRIAEGLAALGHDVTLVSRDAKGPAPIGVTRLLLPQAPGANHRRDRGFARDLSKQRASFDLLIGFNKLPGLDLYFAADDCWRADHNLIQRMLPRGRHHLAMEEAVFGPQSRTKILALSPRQFGAYLLHYPDAAERAQILAPLRDSEQRLLGGGPEIRQAAREKLGLPQSVPLALFVGRDGRLKGLDRALEALSKTPSLHLAAVTEKQEQWQTKAQGLSGRYHALPIASDLSLAYAAADLLLHPARKEAAGKVISEALAAGLPVITTERAGYADLVRQSGAGLILPEPFDQALLALALKDTLGRGRLSIWAQAAETSSDHWSKNGQDEAIALIDRLAKNGTAQSAAPTASFDELWNLQGQVQRSQEGRDTRLSSWQGQPVAIKRHQGAVWREKLKNAFQGKRAIGDAGPEWAALKRLEAIGLGAPKPLAFARSGSRTVLVMAQIDTRCNLEEMARTWPALPPALRLELPRRLGHYAARMHGAGLAHHDFYLTHLYRSDDGNLIALDWHRALIKEKLSERWIVKDLAALLFSAREAMTLSRTQLARFLVAYSGLPARLALTYWRERWRLVDEKARRIARHDQKLRRRAARDV